MAVVNGTFENSVYRITLNRPEKKNPMSLELLTDLYDALEDAEEKQAPIVVMRGAGGAFSAGGDVLEFRDSREPDVQIDKMADMFHRSIVKIRRMNAVVIAVVEGLAFGGGLSLSLACDLIIAEEKTIMNMAYRRIGLTPDGGASLFLPRIAGMKRFNEFYLLSRNIGMEEAREIGLINYVCSKDELEQKVNALITELLALPTETIGGMKDLVNRSLFPSLEAHLDRERRCVSECAKKQEFQERLAARFKKE
jgi:2-(1,2-epoxy-1,2-dihydrophenyl)acetyl-CoA isomerase